MAVTPRLAFALVFVLNCILWTQSSRYGQPPPHRLSPTSLALRPALLKRGELGGAPVGHLGLDAFRTEKECRPFAVPLKDQCAHVEEYCTPSQTVLAIPYLRSYFCSSAPARPFVFAGLLVWLALVFSTLGISASDFFCPNLATIAHLLGLDENVAGVTFLAFGNGSPDVFSTFSAMRANSGSLAIGELLGAASFIVSVVVGSMCIIKPFKIRPGPFLRDIGFFTVAVAALFAILIDGNVHTWEALLLVALYVAYVVVVVVGTWWERRRERRRFLDAQIRSEYADDDSPDPTIFSEPYRDEPETIPTPPTFLHLPSPQGGRRRAISHPGQPTLGLQTTDLPPPRSLSRSHSRNNSVSPSLTHLPSFSLVGALEFREVIASLQSQAAGTALHSFESTPVSYPGGHYHRMGSHSHSHNHTPSGHGGMDEEFNPFDFSLNVPLNGRALPPDPNQTFTAEPEESTPLISVTDSDRDRIPAISHTPPSPTPDAESPPSRRQRVWRAVRRALHVLFPTFHGFREKSLVGKVASTFAAPSVFLLTLTLPVVVMAYDGGHAHHEKPSPAALSPSAADALVSLGSPLVPIDERTTVERAEDEVSAEMHHLAFDRWLMAAQCTFGPLFMTVVLFKNAPYLPWLLLGSGLSGLALGALVISLATDGEHPAPRLARCLMGFTIAVVWVMAIADEVVTVLQTFGFIFGLSDAIIGLTVFAVGNSLADLVANMSVAVFAPVMGFSACFGGPMLNMLLGVGIAGSYVTSQTGVPYELDFSRTLVVSSLGLLVLLLMTAVFVPLNGYYLPRAWGVFLIVAYAVIMSVNVVVEVLSG